jgi:hypothetical protein
VSSTRGRETPSNQIGYSVTGQSLSPSQGKERESTESEPVANSHRVRECLKAASDTLLVIIVPLCFLLHADDKFRKSETYVGMLEGNTVGG